MNLSKFRFLACVGLVCLSTPFTAISQLSSGDRDTSITMLDMARDVIKKNYFDPAYRGIDVDFVFDQVKGRMQAAPNRDSLMMLVASATLALDDSHTYFLPPSRAAEIDYGWTVGLVGDEAFITHVKPRSDAEQKGVKVGDKLVTIDGTQVSRKNLWKMEYRYRAVAPTSKVHMTLLGPGDAQPREVDVLTKISKTGSVVPLQVAYDRGVVKHGWDDKELVNEFVDFGTDLCIWRLHTFEQSDSALEAAISHVKKYKSLIIDLRDNGGGYVDIEKKLVGAIFDHDVKIGDEKSRRETKPVLAKTRGSGAYKGDLIVVVDQGSASASEVFAKVVQLEKRGKVIGDRTAGAVMTSKFVPLELGMENVIYFGMSVAITDLLMSDGKSLEKVGVTPDETVVPKQADLANKRDPVLAYAAKLSGTDLSPDKAGTLFPYVWPK